MKCLNSYLNKENFNRNAIVIIVIIIIIFDVTCSCKQYKLSSNGHKIRTLCHEYNCVLLACSGITTQNLLK